MKKADHKKKEIVLTSGKKIVEQGGSHFHVDRKLIGILSVFIFAAVLLLTVIIFATDTISALRSYSTLQTHWTEFRKEAVGNLENYVLTGNPDFLDAYHSNIAHLRAFTDAREALTGIDSDPQKIFGLLKPFQFRKDEVRSMVKTYKRFGELRDFAMAVENWVRSDQQVARLDSLALHIHAQVNTVSDPAAFQVQWLNKIETIDHALTELKYDLASNLELGTQRLNRIVLWSSVGAGLLLFFIGGFMAHRYMRERNKAEQKIQAQLKEKTILLEEIHHRVKNNLAFVSSLLMLHEEEIENEKALQKLEEAQNQIISIADVHEIIYNTDDFTELSLQKYADLILNRLASIHQTNGTVVDHCIDAGDVSLTINDAIPFGLIVNELATNSYKYAFIDRNRGKIELAVHSSNGKVDVIYRDDGGGLPSAFDMESAARNSLGMKLIYTFLRQLGADYQLQPGEDEFKFTFSFHRN